MTRAQLITKLEHEMQANTTWLRIHAAEGLLDNGATNGIVALFQPEADSATAPYRIGVWRVLARSTTGTERDGYIARIRSALHDTQAKDRISAAESLCKLGAPSQTDRTVITEWVRTADEGTAVYPIWLRLLSGITEDEKIIARFLTSKDPVARLRAAFALGRFKNVSAESLGKIRAQLSVEPADSIARVYMITALLLHEKDASEIAMLEKQMQPYFHGKANEQLEVGLTIGLRKRSEAQAALESMLNDAEPDARIGAANGLLKLTQ